jgi:hypothetical protein
MRVAPYGPCWPSSCAICRWEVVCPCCGVKDRYGKPERGSEWESIKILLEGEGGSNKTNTTSNTRLRLTTQIGPSPRSHWSATEPRNHLPTSKTRERSGTPTSSPLTNTGQTGEHHRSDWSLLVRLGDFHRKAPQRSGWCNTPVRPVTAKKPQNTKQTKN